MNGANVWVGIGPSPRYVGTRHASGQHPTSADEWAQLGRRWGYLAARNARRQRDGVTEARENAVRTAPVDGEP